MRIQAATKSQSRPIARLIMQAMNYDCCQYFAGPHHTLADFECMMTQLVEEEDSQYSYRNTLIATENGTDVLGIIVSYDGKDLHRLRRAFIRAAMKHFNQDFSDMDDETSEGELYLDSLAVSADYRHRGIATALLQAAIERGRALNLPAVGLLVDQGNPSAERLYTAIGFRFVNNSHWGGHPMRHLQYSLTPTTTKD